MNPKLESILTYLEAQYNRSIDDYELRAWYFNGERVIRLTTGYGL
jgi:hypothetical protein